MKISRFLVVAVSLFFFQKAYCCEEAFGSLYSKKASLFSAKIIFRQMHKIVKSGVVPDINITELEILPETKSLIYNQYNRHKDSQYYKVAYLKGSKVFLKKIKGFNGEYELAMLRTLARVGAPILFRGVVRDAEGVLYMVSTFQNSRVFRNAEDIHSYLDEKLQKSAQQEMERVHFLLSSNGIFPGDFQFLVSPAGRVYIIDVENYVING